MAGVDPLTTNSSLLEDVLGNVSETIPDKDTGAVDVFLVLHYLLWYVVQIPVVIFGIGTNLLNIVIFKLIGPKDSISITLTALAISDLGYCVVFSTIRIFGLITDVCDPEYTVIHLRRLTFYMMYYALIFQDISVITTVFVAVQKCLCVALPHRFKDFFTPKRTLATLMCLSLSVTFTYVIILSGIVFKEINFPPHSNKTIIASTLTPLYYQGTTVWRIFNKIILPASSQSIALMCLIIMFVKLRKSVRFRTVDSDSSEKQVSASSTTTKLGYKERRAVNGVAAVLVIFIVSTVPATVLGNFRLIMDDFYNRINRNIVYLMDNCQNILVNVSAAINIFIYLKYNTKFKETAVVLLSRVRFWKERTSASNLQQDGATRN